MKSLTNLCNASQHLHSVLVAKRRPADRNGTILTLLFLLSAAIASAQSIENGNFESSTPTSVGPNWTSSGSFYTWNNSLRAHKESKYAYFGVDSDGQTALVNGAGSIEQSISIPSGE